MPVSGLPDAAETTLDALLQKNVVSSWKITGDRNNSTVFILRLTAQSSDFNSQPLNLRTVHYRKKPPSQVLRDKRRAEERIAAMKHQQPQMNNGQQQGHKQASEFREHYAEFLPSADKESQQSKNTESSQHSLLDDRQARAKNGDVSDCVDMTSKCESVSVPIETVLGLSDTQTGEIKTSEKFDYLSEASVTELSLAENKSPDTSVSFSDEYCNHTNDRGYAASDKYCNHTNDRGYAAFHEELHPDGIRGKLSGLSDKSVQRRITNLSRNKTIEKVTLHRCWNRDTLVCESDDFFFHFDLKKRILQHWFVKQDCRKMTALENEAVFAVTNWASEDTSKSTEELEFLSCCLLTVTTVARQYFHAVWNFDFCTHSVIKLVQCGISVLKWLVFLL